VPLRKLSLVIVTVHAEKRGPLFRQVVFKRDCLDWTDFGANTAIDALHGVDEILVRIIVRMNAVNGADFDT
jgi:hypothetical protein